MSVDYLVSQQQDDGAFVYRVNTNPAVQLKPKYNWLRHAGTLYALADAYRHDSRPVISEALGRGIAYLRQTAIAPVGNWPGTLAVWSDPTRTGSNKPLTAKLGGAGLALASMALAHKIDPKLASLEDMQGLARFILKMQKPDGSFYSKYIPSKGGPDDSWTSLYYPGEAALGLALLFAIDPNPDWRTGSVEALSSLARSRAKRSRVPADHWALIATGAVWSDLSVPERQLLRAHAEKVVSSILAEQIGPGEFMAGGFARDGRTTPTSTRLEGLLAAEALFRDEADFHLDIMVALDAGIGFLLDAQLKEGPFAGGVPRAVAPLPEGSRGYKGFNRRQTEIRIDYVQHALSAFVGYRRLPAEF